jgi:hypothetical protein
MVRRIGTGCDSIGWNVLKLSHCLIDFFLMEWIKNASIVYLQLRRRKIRVLDQMPSAGFHLISSCFT